ncbi:MAG: TetR family transcriptional regulator [Actinobacteria bacterium]|nr:TetR family transcriptional regulator [Actinomycetota bacterium]
MVKAGTKKLLRVGELSRRTGVSTSAINYYVREGLLPPPAKSAPNMAYYDHGYIDMVTTIRVLQREKGMSLSQIKNMVNKGELGWPEVLPPEDFTCVEETAAGSKLALDRREHIMDAAAEVFTEKGYYATTIADLAAMGGVAKGTIYWYFDNKRSILISILDEILRETNEAFTGVIRSASNGLVAILNSVEPALKILQRHGSIYLMCVLEIGSTDRMIQEKCRDIYKLVHAGLKVALNRGMEQGFIRKLNPDVAAYAVIGLIERVSQVAGPTDEQAPLEEKVAEATEFLRRALSA